MPLEKQISFSQLESNDIDDTLIRQLFSLEQDMWARKEGLGEYLFCEDCSRVYSKNHIWEHLPKQEYMETISDIEKHYGIPEVCECGGKLSHCYNPDVYIPEMRERYSERSLLVLMQKGEDIIGFMDGYIGDFSKIYQLEFQSHYQSVGEGTLKSIIEETYKKPLDKDLFSCSSMGTRQQYASFQYIFMLLQNFFTHLPSNHSDITAITELNVGGSLEKIYTSLGAQKVGISLNEEIKSVIHTTSTYTSDIYLQPHLGDIYSQAFQSDLRTFLRRVQVIMKR